MSALQVEDEAPQTQRLLLSSLKETQKKVPDDKKGHQAIPPSLLPTGTNGGEAGAAEAG